MLFAPALVVQDSCYVIYDRNRGTIQLQWDDVKGNQSQPVGSSKTLQNSQCVIGATSVTATALSTTITLDITFKSAFTGLKNIYMYSADGDGSINTGWVQRGTYTVGTLAAPAPSVDSVSPDSGSGIMQTFTFVVSDSQSATNLAAAAVLIAPSSLIPIPVSSSTTGIGNDPAGMGQRPGSKKLSRSARPPRCRTASARSAQPR